MSYRSRYFIFNNVHDPTSSQLSTEQVPAVAQPPISNKISMSTILNAVHNESSEKLRVINI